MPRSGAGLEELIERIRRVNPTGRALPAREERARYAEKARLQSLLIERYPEQVRARAHDDMPGVVSLSVPRLRASAAHAVLEALSDRARALVEEQLRLDAASRDTVVARAPAAGAALPGEDPRLTHAARALAEYDFDCAEAALSSLGEDAAAERAERVRALLMLLDLYVDHLANDRAALDLEPALRGLGSLSEPAHELLGVAAARAGDARAALHHLARCSGDRAAASLASLAWTCVEARAWGDAVQAWAQLQALVMKAAPARAASLARARDELRRRLADSAARARDDELEADEELVRFVKELAPGHPWLRERQESTHRLRAHASVRALIQRAEALAQERCLEDVERALGVITRAQGMSPEEAARAAALAAWAEERRAEVQAARTLAQASTGDAEAACRSYLALSEQARVQVRVAGAEALFTTLDELLAAARDAVSEHAVIRAAAAWVAAQRHAAAVERLRLIAPHAPVLEAVPAFAAEVRRLRAAASTGEEPAASPPPPPTVPRESRLDGLRFVEVDEPPLHPGEIIDLAGTAFRVGTKSFVVTLEAPGHGGAHDVVLRPAGHDAPTRRIRVEGPPRRRLRRVVTMGRRICLIDESRAIWQLTIEPELGVSRVAPDLSGAGSLEECAVVVVDDHVLAFGSVPGSDAPGAWRFVHGATGARLCDVEGAGIHLARGAQGTRFYRVAGASVERLPPGVDPFDRFELPRGVIPSMLVESPLSSRPILLAGSSDPRTTCVWWQPEDGFFRAFGLFNAADHGVPVEAAALTGRGLWVVTRRSDGMTLVHGVEAGRAALRAGRGAEPVAGYLGLVVDPSGRRGWVIRREVTAGPAIDPLILRADQAAA